jgi:DNA-binding MarR family transcriptional regulator
MKVLRPPSLQERILVLLRSHPGLSQREIARELDQSQSTINDYVRRMAEANLLKVERAGVTNHCFVVEMD